MAPLYPSDDFLSLSAYKIKIKLELDKLMGAFQNIKVDLTKTKIKNISNPNRCVKWRCKNVYVSNACKDILCFR